MLFSCDGKIGEKGSQMLLHGVKVLDLSTHIPGPFCSMLLADLGAEVIKIEAPPHGDYFRLVGSSINKSGDYFRMFNRNKRSITLNLKARKGREVFFELTKRSDIMLESFRPGVTDKLGVGYGDVKNINPRIIYCSISGYGKDGPYKNRVGHDSNYNALGGVIGLTAESEGNRPSVVGINISDYFAALFAGISILAAFIGRDKTGQGQHIDVAMLDVMVSLLTIHAADYFFTGKIWKPGESPFSGGCIAHKVYETKDGRHMVTAILEKKFWKKFCRIIGEEHLGEANHLELGQDSEEYKTIKDAFLTKTREEWVSLFNGEGVCCEPVNNIEEVFQDPQVLFRKMVMELEDPRVGKTKHLAFPVKFSESSTNIRSLSPDLGQHSEEVLKEIGYDEREIEELNRAGVI